MPDMDLPPVETTTEPATYDFSKFYLFTMSVEWAYNSIWSRYDGVHFVHDNIQSINVYKYDHFDIYKYDHFDIYKYNHFDIYKYDHIDIYKYDHIDMLNLDYLAPSM
ncbi:hypothetical protein WR25_21711 [Diploscapter pachys]|uniref:Uncharacterized protein n=1 Tax=Diploscapter pachys TaxID=2018661 RepID=A0A2A2LCS1_9BILA|nr:hypothetical protein WR25_21711 [Diploscapter pachys]